MSTQVQVGHTLIIARTWREERILHAVECCEHRQRYGLPTNRRAEQMTCSQCTGRSDCPVLGKPASECW
jgi:hypothetical protein